MLPFDVTVAQLFILWIVSAIRFNSVPRHFFGGGGGGFNKIFFGKGGGGGGGGRETDVKQIHLRKEDRDLGAVAP